MLNLCQFRVLTNEASSHVRLPMVTVAGRFNSLTSRFANIQFANMFSRVAFKRSPLNVKSIKRLVRC